MLDRTLLLALKNRLPRTWPAFFERYGNFTAAQVAAIPALLDGANVLLSAPTASGKTAAVLAPLIERHCPPRRSPNQLRILYLTPTRALVNDLQTRLDHPLETLGVKLGAKTRDSAFARTRPPDVLLTTPESLDSLLTTDARIFAHLRAIVIDELHLFDGTPRGDQLRVLLNRIRRIRAYAVGHGDASDTAIQYVALSATLANPEAAATRYFTPVQVVHIPGGRAVEAEMVALATEGNAELKAYLTTFRARGWRKALVFCNSRAEVEAYAAAVRDSSPFGSDVFTHYSNLEPQRRREIEAAFAAAGAAICFTSSTLELGIDIGTIDIVMLIGPPGSPASFTQRIGRGNRRGRVTRVTCCYRTPLEQLVFEALLNEVRGIEDAGSGMRDAKLHTSSHLVTPSPCHLVPSSPFRPSVAIQQIFSLIKQSPTAAARLAELSDLFTTMLQADDLLAILGNLTQRDYLVAGRPGEWRAGPRLNKLYDEQNSAQVSLSIYTNIQMNDAPLVAIRDQHTQRVVARVDALWLDRDALTLEGRALNVEWYDGEALWVTSHGSAEAAPLSIYRSVRQLLSYELARLLPTQLGLSPGDAPYVAAPEGWWWFHCLGDLYGRAALDLLRYRVPAHEAANPGLALHLADPPQVPPDWSEPRVVQYLSDTYRQYEPLLDLGPFHHLLPPTLRRRAVVEQFDVPRFLAAVSVLHPLVAPEGLREELSLLLQ